MIYKKTSMTKVMLALLLLLMTTAGNIWAQTTPTVSGVDEITATTAIGHGNVTYQGQGTVTERGFCWNTAANPTIAENLYCKSGSGTGDFTADITGLTPNRTYYVRAYAVAVADTGADTIYSVQEQEFQTQVQVVTTVDVIHIRTNYAVGVGKVVSGSYGGTVTERGVCFSTTNQTPHINDSDVTHISSGAGVGNYSVEMTGLEENTNYYLRTYAIVTDGDEIDTVYGEKKVFNTHVHMQNGTIEVGDGEFVFTDSESRDGWYDHNEDYTLVFIPSNPSNGVKIDFNSMLINNDFLYIYDGDISTSNLIGVFTCNDYHAYKHSADPEDSPISVFGMGGADGNGKIFTVTSHSHMTLRFVSDYRWRDAGWTAHVSQAPFTPQPPTIAKTACTNNEFVLLRTSKGQHSTTLKYDIAFGGEEPETPNTIYTGPINIGNGEYPVKISVMTEIMETADSSRFSETKTYIFGDESLVIPPYQPTIVRNGNTSSVTISVVRPADLNDTWSIKYTLDGTDPATSATAQVISHTTEDPITEEVTTIGTVDLPDFCTVKAVTQGTTCPDIYSDTTKFDYTCGVDSKIKLLPPTITFVPHDNDISKAHTTITPSTDGCTIHFNVNDGQVNVYHDYDSIIEVNANDRVKAWVSKGDPDCYDDSEPAIRTYLPGSDIPGGGSGVFGDVVYLDDREPHSWSYYSDENQPVHSLHPADVKITYFGNGTGTVSTTDGPTPASISWTADATGVQVGPGAPGNQFVYFETLEAGGYSIDNSGYINLEPNYDGASHDYPYSLIPNPFSVRPKYEGPSTSTVYVNGRSWNNGGEEYGNGLIRVDYVGADGTSHYWERTNNSGNVNTTITVLDGTTLTLTAVGGWYNGGNGGVSNITARYDNAYGAQIAHAECGWYGEQVTAQGTVGSNTGDDYRGFYAWRVKRLKGVTIEDAYGKSYDVDSIIPAETRLLFHTENEYNNEVDFEALWAKAYVVESNTESGLNANVSYERNFVVGLTSIGNALTVPVTYSSYYPDGTRAHNNNVTIGDFTCQADTKFEYMNLRRNNNNNNNAITANNHYLCFGRGINPNNQYVARIVQGIGFGSQVGDLNYTIRVESGRYAQGDAQFGTNRGSRFTFVYDGNNSEGWSQVTGRCQVKSIMGCDYDRAQGVNDNLFVANSTKIFYSYQCHFPSNRNMDKETFNLVVKSGTYQEGYWDNPNNGDYLWSFYCGQNNSEEEWDGNPHPNTFPGIRYVTVEGGLMGSMNGGNGTRRTFTATHAELASSIRIKGGTFHGSVFGGAANTRSTASRRIVVTSSEIQGWIAGGSNGTDTQQDKAIIDGDTYIYVGGDAIVGGDNAKRIGLLNLDNGQTPSNGGQIFGASRGNQGQRACADHSYVVVADNAKVYNNNNDPRFEPGGNVYGGGDHGYIMQKANVYILGGEIGRHVFGGAYNHHINNYNTDIPATRVYIRGGVVKGSVHGGSNSYGNIGGVNDAGERDAIVEMVGGVVGTEGSFVDGKVFGGGLGENADVLGNTFVTIRGGLVVNNVYGGGNQGSVIRNNTTGTGGKATVTIQGGQIGDIHSDTNPTKGNVYGGGKGLAHQAVLTDPNKTTVNETEVNIIGSNIMGSVFGGGENGFVYTNTLVTVEGGQVGGYPGETSGEEHQDCDNPYHGSVYGGGSGMNFENGEVVQCYPEDGWVMGNTTVNIVSGAHVMRNVYGGSNVASVGQFQTDGNGNASIDAFGYYIPTPNTGLATVNISGGIIGTTGTDYDAQGNAKGLANGMVYGGTHGRAILSDQDFMKFANVNNTHVIIAAGADIRGSVFGGGEDGRVLDSTFVEIIDGTIGATLTAEENLVNPDGSGMTIFRGNVYGGGRGLDSIRPSGSSTYVLIKGAGFVKNNTRVLVTGGLVRHNVYGGGSLASVGIPEDDDTGRATVIIRGGQVGTSGANNGSVFGSGRGMPVKQNSTVDYSEFAFVKNTFVTIDSSAKVMRSVFGGGENGHVRQKTNVDIKGGTIGITNKNVDFFKYAGNVYGGGRGVDHTNAYTYGISPTAGKVNVETKVNVTGGRIYRNVYGGGSMASVGEVVKDSNGNTLYYYYNEVEETSTTNPDATGVPTDSYLKPMTGTGKASVEISGGEIGIDGDENGHVFGSARGLSGPQYRHLSYAGETYVTITENAKIHGSVFGSGEDGHVLTNTHVLVEGGEIGTYGYTGYEGNVYGGGRGLDTYVDPEQPSIELFSATAGKTFGNTNVEIMGGWVKGSVYGGGRLASVGVGNEVPDNNVYHTGLATVTIGDGNGTGEAVVGTTHDSQSSVIYGGNVYGGGKGFAGASYKYLTYVKNTHVTIQDGADIHGSVFGGGEDGHVRQNSLVDVVGGEVGDPESSCNNRYHGNVYGGGRGIDRVNDGSEFLYSWTAGRVNWNATVNISGGRIYRNVYGGGNVASVGMVRLDENDQQVLIPSGINPNVQNLIPLDTLGNPQFIKVGQNWVTNPDFQEAKITGWARVNITGGIIGTNEDLDYEHGNVFGSCHGKAGEAYQYLAYVHNTDVRVDQGDNKTTLIHGSVFGGGEDGHVNLHTKVTVNKGQIGSKEGDDKKGNVYGGGRGIDEDANGNLSATAGLVKGHTRIYINGGLVNNSVYGGGNMSVVWEEKVTNVNGGEVKANVFGGCKAVPEGRKHRGMKTVNMRGGHVYGNVYGCSKNSLDGDDDLTHKPSFNDLPNSLMATAFVNISGGIIGGGPGSGSSTVGNVHGAGMAGRVNGSTFVNIGKDAILLAKNRESNHYFNDSGGDDENLEGIFADDDHNPTVGKLIIRGSVYGGSDYYGSASATGWDHHDVTGITNIIIDGKDYETTNESESAANFMAIEGGLFGCGTHCESGYLGRNILLKNYGTRTPVGNVEMTNTTRTLTTIQRCNNLLVDNSNVNLSGMSDITEQSNRNYAVLNVDSTLYMANASAFNLGKQTVPAYMDSIHCVRSLHLMRDGAVDTSVYHRYLHEADSLKWEWIGVNPVGENTQDNARLFYTTSAPSNPLNFDKENVILFQGDSRLWVRYHKMVTTGTGSTATTENKQYYGELQGFFRMKSHFEPYGTESFAFARPKVTPNNNPIPIDGHPEFDFDEDNTSDNDTLNGADGGFLSYEIRKNFFTEQGHMVLNYTYPAEGDDGGMPFTKTKQYPYTNIAKLTRGNYTLDPEEYREWVIPQLKGNVWYVDGRGIGTGGWGQDKYHKDGWGHYPDKPKLTVTGAKGDPNDETHRGGICVDDVQGNGFLNFNYATDIIFVVGPVSAALEGELLNLAPVPDGQASPATNYTLKLYRYPGGHLMSRGGTDATLSTNPQPAPTDSSYDGKPSQSSEGPGANVLSLLEVEDDQDLTLNNVLFDGLFNYRQDEMSYFPIPASYSGEMVRVRKPMVVTYSNSTFTLTGSVAPLETGMSKFGTILRRGYNKTNADVWYTDASYNGDVHHGGAVYVDKDATVNVNGLVSVEESFQKLILGDGPGTDSATINCNVYLPTFHKHLYINGPLTEGSKVGVTSPIKNAEPHYIHNTFSPVAVAIDEVNAVTHASFAWEKNMFLDDQQWFFVNNHEKVNSKDTYYSSNIADYDPEQVDGHYDPSKTLFFGWTWGNVVRKAPVDFAFNNIDDPEDLAWLISLVDSLNRQKPQTLSNVGIIKQTRDLDMMQYIWVPVGAVKPYCKEFGGKYDGQGHLINHLDIAYLGTGDRRYERLYYGLFGSVNGGEVNRTFVTSGYMRPIGSSIVGGMVGLLNSGMVSNSEASVDIHCPETTSSTTVVAGGLVGDITNGEIHSSMAMPVLNASKFDFIGGLVGRAEGNKPQKIYNSFANAKFLLSTATDASGVVGGLVGVNDHAEVANCYSHLQNGCIGLTSNFALLVGQSNGGSIKHSYGQGYGTGNTPFPLERLLSTSESRLEECYYYGPVMDADNLGYMYYDNVVTLGEDENAKKVTMFRLLQKWAEKTNTTPNNANKYSLWSRPAIPEINGDLPVLLLCNGNDTEDYGYRLGNGDFRSLATYKFGCPQTGPQIQIDPLVFDENNKGVVLHYGGPVRFEQGQELNPMLDLLETQGNIYRDHIYIYGDVSENITKLTEQKYAATKVSIHEDASIQHPGTLANHAQTYVGISLRNDYGKAVSTPDVNYGLPNVSYDLPRDWHMLSTPLSDAPLGFDYKGHNKPVPGQENYNNALDNTNPAGYFNNIWHNHPMEFSWLNDGQANGNKRYWMYGWENSLSQKGQETAETGPGWVDGYFPSRVASAGTNITGFEFGQGWIEGSDEKNRYPYGMDFYTWTEPDYHWINFKRNGPNHWHTDTYEEDDWHHNHINYKPYGFYDPEQPEKYPINVNEETLIVGRGYMVSISDTTFMQSHGKLNAGDTSIILTKSGRYLKGWNLVGNPYHAYLNFDALAKANLDVLGKYKNNHFYVVYDAKKFEGSPYTAYRYYPITGSTNGDYAECYLHPHQGFYVYASNAGSLQFMEKMTAPRASFDENEGHFRDQGMNDRPAYPLVNLYLSSENGCADVTVIEFNRPEWGGAMKMKELRRGNGLFYAHHGEDGYAALFTKKGADRVPLWFVAKEDDTFTIKWNTANGEFLSLYLIDNLTGVTYDMLANDSYTFQGHEGDYPSRFLIVFELLEEDPEEPEEPEVDDDESQFFAFFDGSQWVVTGDGVLDLIDVYGHVLWRDRVNGQCRVPLSEVASGVYLMRLTNNKGSKVQKIIVY